MPASQGQTGFGQTAGQRAGWQRGRFLQGEQVAPSSPAVGTASVIMWLQLCSLTPAKQRINQPYPELPARPSAGPRSLAARQRPRMPQLFPFKEEESEKTNI